jgi:hypothetical protein
MVDAVHVDRDQHRLQPAFEPLRKADVAVLHRSRAEDRETVAQHDDDRNIEHDHGEPIDPGRQDVFDRMVAHRRRHIDIRVRVVQRVKAPEERHRMLAPVHEVTHQVEEQEPRPEAQTGVGYRPRWKGAARHHLELRAKGFSRRENNACEKEVDEPETDIPEPAPQGRKFPPPPRPAQLPERDGKQAAKNND